MKAGLSRWLGALLLAGLCQAGARAEAIPNLRGAQDAPVTILVFSAFACQYCAETRAALEQVLAQYPGKVNLVYKHFPLGADAGAYLPHEAALAAGEQGKFWEMHDALFAHQGQLADRTGIEALARSLHLDPLRFDAALDSRRGAARIQADVAEANALKVQATPTFYIGGYKFEGAQPASVFKTVIDYMLTAGPAGRAQSLQDKLRQTEQQLTPAIEKMRGTK
ncbi:DsbA family protein [Pseudoduganella violaceinigra]|uniref:DsbA family protein n=1 Tax=Pseudoduganella violaceinigra TaxID=246602 RepID=UPI000400AB9A|nr:thioredoxin domain-containing protein [Pseudoduganella violaceinigra]